MPDSWWSKVKISGTLGRSERAETHVVDDLSGPAELSEDLIVGKSGHLRREKECVSC